MPTVGVVEVLIFLLLYVVFWPTVIFGASYFAVRLALKRTSLRSETPNALKVLRVRYARGEVSRDEFERIRGDLE